MQRHTDPQANCFLLVIVVEMTKWFFTGRVWCFGFSHKFVIDGHLSEFLESTKLLWSLQIHAHQYDLSLIIDS
jgi:hypothetical protein